MTTRTIIIHAIGVLFALWYWGNIIRSMMLALRYGFRYGFRLPRSMHYAAIGLLVVELLVLALFPLDIRTIGLKLGIILLSFPLSPYVGWAVAGGPERARAENG
jgi:hypothetical protein